jgi:hypothetical protein
MEESNNVSSRRNFFKIILIIAILIIVAVFYWYEWRPASIKHDCSWVEYSLPEAPEITKDQYNECSVGKSKIDIVLSCDSPHPARPATRGWKKASEKAYNFCIHEKGL